jgi:hypothetical protein
VYPISLEPTSKRMPVDPAERGKQSSTDVSLRPTRQGERFADPRQPRR